MEHENSSAGQALRDWWKRDDVLTGLISGDKHNSKIIFNINRANKSIGRMMSDLKAVLERDDLEILDREMVPRNVRLSGDEDIYKFRVGKEGSLQLVSFLNTMTKK